MPAPTLFPEGFGINLLPPSIPLELTDYSNQLAERTSGLEALPMLGAGQPVQSPIPRPMPPPAPPPPTTLQEVSRGITGAAPLLAGVGSALMGGQSTPQGQAAGVVAGGLQSMSMNEQMRRMVQDYMTGGGGGRGMGPTGSQQLGPTGFEAAGLAPGQIEALYKTGMGATTATRREPVEIMKDLATVHNLVATGSYHEAQVPFLLAQAQKALVEAQNLPATNLVELQRKIMETAKLQEDIKTLQLGRQKTAGEMAETEAKTAKIREEVPETKARTEKIQEETRTSKFWNTPQGKTLAAEIDAYKTVQSRGMMELNLKDRTIVLDPTTGASKVFMHGMSPDVAGGAVSGTQAKYGMMMAVGEFLQAARQNIISKYPPGDQRAIQEFEKLRTMLKPSLVTGEVDVSQLFAVLTPAQQAQFKQRADEYSGAYGPRTSNLSKVSPIQPEQPAQPATPPAKTAMDAVVDDLIANSSRFKTEQEAIDYVRSQGVITSDAGISMVLDAARKKVGGKPKPKPQSSIGPKEAGAVEATEPEPVYTEELTHTPYKRERKFRIPGITTPLSRGTK